MTFVSRQLGHASLATTLGAYAYLFAQAGHAAARKTLKASYGSWPSTTTVLASFRQPSVLGFPGRLLLQIWLAVICVAGPLRMVCEQPHENELHMVFPLPGGSM